MAVPRLEAEIVEQILAAPNSETHDQVGERLGIAAVTVKKYRLKARHQREEVAREVIARHVEENIPDALADLTDLRRIARENFEASGDARQGNLWLQAVKATLEHVKPDDADLDAVIDQELAAFHQDRQRSLPAAPAGTPLVGNGHPAKL